MRMGLRYVKGLGEGDWSRIEGARCVSPFVSLHDFVRRTELDKGPLAALAEAGAFEAFGLDRRSALWEVLGLVHTRASSLPIATRERRLAFEPLSLFEEVIWDYRSTDHSPRRHPLAPMRSELTARGLPDARAVAAMRDGRRVRYAGLVICRQQPGTAQGVTFMTLEDETGFVNVVLWPSIFECYAVLAKTATFLGITGTLQAQQEVVHLVADRLWKPQVGCAPTSAVSRDFH